MKLRHRRGRLAAFAVGIGASLGLVIGVAFAFNPTLSDFEIEGDLTSGIFDGEVPAGATTVTGVDWAAGASGTGALTAAGLDNPAEPGTAALVQDPVSGNNDTSTFQASKENDNSTITTATDGKKVSQTPWTIVTGQSQPKDDLTNTYFYALVDGNQADVVVGAERTSVNGESHLDFEFNQLDWVACPSDPLDLCPQRKEGDVLVAANIDPDGVTTFYKVYVWDLPGGVDAGAGLRGAVTPASTVNCDGYAINGTKPAKFAGCPWEEVVFQQNEIIGVLNRAPVAAGPWGSRDSANALRTTIPTAGFFEAFLDFDALGFAPSCPGFAKASVKTRSSGEGITSSMSDLAGPVDINLDTCATITITKDTVPNDGTNFAYTTTGTGLSAFSLDDDADPTLSNTKTFTVAPGAYTVTETLPNAGYTLTNLTCSATGTGTTATPTLATGLATINLGNNGAVSCTYTNTAFGTIRIVKDTVPNDGTDFAYTTTGTGLSAFSLDDDSDPTLSNTKTFTVAPGSYTVTESLPNTGYDLSNLACVTTGTGTSATTNLGTGVSSITLAPAGDVTCTYTNTKRGTITIIKDTVPDGPRDFAYTTSGTGLSNFSLDDDADGTLSNTKVFSVVPGSYTVTESLPVSGFDLTALSCQVTGTGTSATPTLATGLSSITMAAGGTATCTYTNTQRGAITIIKDVVPDGAQDFAYTVSGTGLTAFSLDDDANATLNNSITFNDLMPGSYSVTETLPVTGFDLTALSCQVTGSGTSATPTLATGLSSITLGAGGTATCTYTNTQRGKITVIKDTVPDGPQDFAFTTSGTGLSGFSLDDDTNATLSNTKVFENVLPGTYSVTETAVTGFDLTALSCTTSGSGTSATTTVGSGVSDITLGAGGDVTCTYTNTQRGSITIVKATVPTSDPQDFAYGSTASTSTAIGSFSLDTDSADVALPSTRTFNNLKPGTYTVTETLPSGWELESLSCTTGGSQNGTTPTRADITLPAGGAITCTFTNHAKFTIIVLVCHEGSDTLYASTVTIDGVDLTSLASGGGVAVATDAQLCSLGGATFGNKDTGGHPGNVNIPN